MTPSPEKLAALRRALFAGLAAVAEHSEWSSRVRAERQRMRGVQARLAAIEAVARYRALKREADNA